MGEFKPKKPGKRQSNLTLRLIEVVIVLLVIYVVAAWILGGTPVTRISAPTNITFTNATSLLTVSGGEYAVSLASSTSTSAELYVTKVPEFQNPTFYVTLYIDNTTNFNGTAGRYANMQLKLLSTGSESAVIEITPIPSTILLNPTATRIIVVGSTLTPVVVGGKVNLTTVPTTTVPGATTSVSTTATTTIAGQVGGYYKAQSILASSTYFALMNNYTKFYKNTVNCSAPLYNFTFNSYNHISPSGPTTYENVSVLTPYTVVLNITNSSTSIYDATYRTVSHSPQTTGVALVVAINVTAGYVSNVIYEGIFAGESYAALSTSYSTAKNLGSCGAMVA